jgi:hypothetical protein
MVGRTSRVAELAALTAVCSLGYQVGQAMLSWRNLYSNQEDITV